MIARNWHMHVVVAGLYILLTAVMTWPAVLHMGDSVIGSGGDPWQAVWRFGDTYDRAAQSAQNGHVWNFIRDEFFGGGEARLVNLSVWPWMPLKIFFGLPTAYNLVYFLSFVLSGYGMYLFVSLWRGKGKHASVWLKESPAFLAGMYYMFLPFHSAHSLGHFGAMQTQWIPLSLFVVVQLFRRFSWWKVLALWALLTVQSWTEHHYALWLGILAIVSAILLRRQVGQLLRQRTYRWAVVLLIVVTSLSAGLSYYPTIRLSALGDSLELGQAQTIRFSADLFAFVVPASFHTLWGKPFHSVFGEAFTGNMSEATMFLGWVPLLLVLFFRQSIPAAHRKYWLPVVFVFLLIALGPRLHVFGKVFDWPMPYALVDSWPVFSAVRTVARATVMIGVAMSVLLFWVLQNNINRVGSAVVVGILLLLEFLFMSVPRQSAQLSEIYSYVRPGIGSRIIEIPAATNYTAASRALFASQQHGKEVLGNNALERAQDSEDFDLPRAVPGVRQLLYLRTVDLRRDRSEFFAQTLAESLPDALKFFDVGEIIVHLDSLTALEISAIRGFLEEDVGLIPKAIPDAVLYEVPATYAGKHDGVFLMRDKRWKAVGLDVKRGHVYGEVEPSAAVTLVNVTSTPVPMRIKLFVAPESPSSLRLTRAGSVIGEIKPGGVGVYPIGALPGSTTIDFEAIGDGKAIVQDPQLLYGQ